LDWSRATQIQTSRFANANWSEWELYCSKAQIDVSAARKLVLGTSRLALEAGVEGLGIAMGRLPLIDDDLAAGRLAVAAD